jgi:hypothetical protein
LERARYYWDVMKSALQTRIPWAERGRALYAAFQRTWWERSRLAREALAVLRIGGESDG